MTSSCHGPLLLRNVFSFSNQRRDLVGVGSLLVGVRHGHGLGHSSLAAAVLSSRVWIDNSMRHQNGRSRDAVASSSLFVSSSASSLFPTLPCPNHGVSRPRCLPALSFHARVCFVGPALSVAYGGIDGAPLAGFSESVISISSQEGSPAGTVCRDATASIPLW